VTPAGYAHPAYAEALAEFGAPIELEACGGWVLRRRIPASDRYDAMSCYPLFACRDWSQLASDLAENPADLVSLTLVLDAFGDYEPAALADDLNVMVRFKEHFVTDLRRPATEIASRNHRKHALKAPVDVEVCEDPLALLDTWTALYANLAQRHGITGIRAFSRLSFAKQLCVPGLVAFRAIHDGRTVGLDLWYLHDGIAYAHLVAMSDEGYALHTSYALKWYALNYFANRAHWLDLGGAPGPGDAVGAGLAHFKGGWSTGTRPTYLAGRVYDPSAYLDETRLRGIPTSDYFPAYRHGEFDQAPRVTAG
jgi:hypothetical protein